MAAIAGNAMWISFILAAVIATFTGLSYAELTSMFPKSAAEYMFVKKRIWNETFCVSDRMACNIRCSNVCCSSICRIFQLSCSLSSWNQSGLGKCVIDRDPFWAELCWHPRISMDQYNIYVDRRVSGLAIIIGAGIFLSSASSPPDTDYYFRMPLSMTSPAIAFGEILGAAGLAFFAYFGFENLADISEETKNPRKTIPLALFLSIIITTVIYVLVSESLQYLLQVGKTFHQQALLLRMSQTRYLAGQV